MFAAATDFHNFRFFGFTTILAAVFAARFSATVARRMLALLISFGHLGTLLSFNPRAAR